MPDVSPLTAVEDLRNVLSLEIPASFVKQELIQESDDQRTAAYRLTWYSRANNEPNGDQLDIGTIIDDAAADLLGRQYDLDFKIGHEDEGKLNTSTVRAQSKTREASMRSADADTAIPLTLYVGQDVFNVAIDGDSFAVLQNGDLIEAGLPSVPYALGRLTVHALHHLPDIEAEAAVDAGHPNDFLAGIAEAIIDAPDVTDEALEHFVTFYEMVTLRDFEAGQGEP